MSSITVNYERSPEVQNINLNVSHLAPIVLDLSAVPQEDRKAPAKELLGASTLCCFCSALGNAIIARGGVYTSIGGKASVEAGKNEDNLDRILGIALDVTVEAPKEHQEVVEHCIKVVRQGCLVTLSISPCINMTYNIETRYTK